MINGEIENMMYAKRIDANGNTVWAFQYKNPDKAIIAFANKLYDVKKYIVQNTHYKCALGFNLCGLYIKTEYPDVLPLIKNVIDYVECLKLRYIEESKNDNQA